MAKLPRSTLRKFEAGIAQGTIPEPDDAAHDGFFSAWSDLWTSLGEDWSKAQASRARREVAALVELSNAVPGDGLVVGIACNQPRLVELAIDAAGSMKQAKLLTALKKIATHIPDAVMSLDHPGARLEWYESRAGKAHAAALEKLEERVQDEDITNSLMLACVRRVIAEPEEFFAGK